MKRGPRVPEATPMRKNDHLIEPFLAGLPKPKPKARARLVPLLLGILVVIALAVTWYTLVLMLS
ncbi:MAG TPA: hypothetical protein EYG26_10085 [Planctomycetes bacterium]|nr:hypothetical protein [Planctomycetota bacterium]